MRIDSSFLQNNFALRSANTPIAANNGQQSDLIKTLNNIFSQSFEGKTEDTISKEMQEKLVELEKEAKAAEAEAETSPDKKQLLELLKKDMEFLNNADSIHDEMIERLNQELQKHQETKEKYQSMLDGKTSMSEFMQAAMSKEEYEKMPETQVVYSADGTAKEQTISYEEYKSLWDGQQTELARKEVSTLLGWTQERIDRFPERVRIAEKCHDFRVTMTKAGVKSICKALGREAPELKTSENHVWKTFEKMAANEAQNDRDIIDAMDKLKEEDPENSAVYTELINLASDWQTKHLNALA